MNPVRERVLREIVTRLASAIAPIPVLRMPAVPVTREASPALLLFVDGDSITAHANHLVDRLLIVRLAVVARGADAFDVADQTLVAAHAAMLADPNLGGAGHCRARDRLRMGVRRRRRRGRRAACPLRDPLPHPRH